MPHDVKERNILNAIQVKIDNNVRMLAELHARWEREDEIARENQIVKFILSPPLAILKFQVLLNLLLLMGLTKSPLLL